MGDAAVAVGVFDLVGVVLEGAAGGVSEAGDAEEKISGRGVDAGKGDAAAGFEGGGA